MGFDWRKHMAFHGGDDEDLGLESLEQTPPKTERQFVKVETPTTSYPSFVQSSLTKSMSSYDSSKSKLHQFLAQTYTTLQTNGRGILVFHEVGTGKTRLAVMIAKHFAEMEPSRNILILAPKSLHENTRKTVEEFDKEHKEKYKYVSLNASNMFHRLITDDSDAILEKNLGDFVQIQKSLENTLLIIDEFHNLANAITNGSKNAVQLYDKIMDTRNIRLVFLSGTPMVNGPFELVPTFNMLRGPISSRNARGKRDKQDVLLPEFEKDFTKTFVDSQNNKPQNSHIFMNRVFGLVSYYGTDTASNPDFPKEKPMKVVKVPMSSWQFSQYRTMRDIEFKEESNKQKRKPSTTPFTKSSGASSSYRIRSRQTSNYAVPEALIKVSGSKIEKKLDSITDEHLGKTYAGKFHAIWENIQKHPNTVGLVYSEFIAVGINLFAQFLQFRGWTAYDQKKTSKQTFAVISGDVSDDDRTAIIKVITSQDNMHGERISLLLISKTGAEGLDLKFIRHIHILEPFWNQARIVQVIARGVRYRSHIDLPPSERDVQPYIYIAGYPSELTKEEKSGLEPLTTDQNIYINAVKSQQLIHEFETLLIRASFDCESNKSSKDCLKCYPDGIHMYESLTEDLKRPANVCREVKEDEVEVQEIHVELATGPKTFYYQQDAFKIKIFYFDEQMQGYVELPETDPIFGDIVKKLALLDQE